MSKAPTDLFADRLTIADGIREWAGKCGVYCLISESGEIVYIGQSDNVGRRFKQHSKQKTGLFCQVAAWHHPRRDVRREVEGEQIRKLCPTYNVRHNPTKAYGYTDYVAFVNDPTNSDEIKQIISQVQQREQH